MDAGKHRFDQLLVKYYYVGPMASSVRGCAKAVYPWTGSVIFVWHCRDRMAQPRAKYMQRRLYFPTKRFEIVFESTVKNLVWLEVFQRFRTALEDVSIFVINFFHQYTRQKRSQPTVNQPPAPQTTANPTQIIKCVLCWNRQKDTAKSVLTSQHSGLLRGKIVL